MLQKIPIKSKDEVQSSQSHVQPNAQHPLNAIATQSPYSQHLAQLSSIANVSAGVEAEG